MKNKKFFRKIRKTISANILHPTHWHVSMVVAVAAILLTSFKSSGEMMRALHGTVPVHAAVMDNVHLRDAETGHAPIILNVARHVASSGS